MGFLETGFGFFSLIIIWNILLLGFGGIPDSSFLSSTDVAGLDHPGQLNPEQIQTQTSGGTPYIAPTTIPEQNKPFFNQVFDALQSIFNFLSKLLFGSSEAIEKSGIPSPINWIMGKIIYFFVIGYIAAYGINVVSSALGGGTK